jgi:hypothetical protein
MLKYVTLLCLLIAATLYTVGGRTDAPLRDGLAGKLAPLVYQDPGQVTPAPSDVVAARPGPALPQPEAIPAAASVASVARPQPELAGRSVISAAFATAEPQAGLDAQEAQSLTLALPLVEAPPAAGPSPAAAAAPPTETDAAPVVHYVAANTVNVRAGPSAQSESLTKLDRGEAVLVLPSDTPGWSMIRIEGDGLEGYIATRFLGDPPQDGIFTPVN